MVAHGGSAIPKGFFVFTTLIIRLSRGKLSLFTVSKIILVNIKQINTESF
jgi:hypothetical protein